MGKNKGSASTRHSPKPTVRGFPKIIMLLKPEDVENLRTEADIVHLVYHRNKNQHRQSKWWSHLNMLKRRLAKLLDSLAHKKDREARSMVEFLVQKLIPGCYAKFYQLIEVGNFITLGFALVALLSRIYCVLIEADGLGTPATRAMAKRMIETPKVVLDGVDDDIGEVLSVPSPTPVVITKPTVKDAKATKEKKTKDKKKKKKKSAIDDIFG